MKAKDFDQGGRKYTATKRFPYGLSRSGEFTRDQVGLLESHGYAYEALATGEREPETKSEKDFVKFCQGIKGPESPHEKAWKRYCDKALAGDAAFALCCSLGSTDDVDDGPVDLDDMED